MADKKITQLPASTVPLAGTEVLPIVQGTTPTTKQVSVADLTAGRAISATQYTSTIATGTAPLVVASTTEVANLKAATATLADSANAVKSNATTGLLQVTGPAAASTRVMTTPDANFTVARTDAANSFTANQTLATGNLVIGTSGKGIDFSATAGTGTSELLADYETGTWTPSLVGSTTAGDYVYDTNRTGGYYTKIGNVVTVRGSLSISSTNSAGSGNARLSGLPYAQAASVPSTTSVRQPGSMLMQSGPTLASSYVFVTTESTQTYMSMANGTTSSWSFISVGDVATALSIWSFEITYQTA